MARSTGSSFATYRLNGSQYNTLHRTSLDGTTLLIDVNPTTVGPNGYLAVFLTTSHRPAGGGQTAGTYTLEYRVGGDQTVGSRVRSGRNGIVTLGGAPGTWTTLSIDPVADIGALWPWVDGRDASLYTVALGVGSKQGFRTEGHLDFLRLDRARKGPTEVLALQGELMGAYAPRFPSVTQHAALEWSMLHQHMNWYGGSLTLPPPTNPPWQKDTSGAAMVAATQRIHDAGGVASYNHPFGSGTGSASSQSAQDSARRGRATELIAARAYGCDVLEVGYPVKGGVQIGGYLSLWDALSRNGIFITGNGVSDDHSGQNWLTQSANFVTWAWAESTDRGALTQALAAGRVYWGNPAAFRGQIDLLVDGYVPMGAVSVESMASRTLRVIATGLPSGSTVDVVTGPVDYAGSAFPDPVTSTKTIPASAFGAGFADTVVDTTSDTFVRAVVRSSSGSIVAGSNPVWLLRTPPAAGIPLARRVAPAGPVGPRASFTWVADGRTVAFDASGSTAGDTPLATYAWDFGDGGVDSGAAPSHTFSEDNSFTVILTVTDDGQLTSTTSRAVVISTAPPPPPPPPPVIALAGAARFNANTTSASVTIPPGVRAGDGLLLFVTANSTSAVMTLPAGWALVREQVSGTLISRLLVRTAAASDAGSAVLVKMSTYAKVAMEVLAYRGVAAADFATATSAAQTSTASHPTPSGSVALDGSWVISYWVDKSAGTTTAWTAPPGVVTRGTSYGSAGGALATLSADSGQGVPPGPCGGLVATSNASASSATTWTVVLRP
ncbi:MAG TPA: PKD domain-containing protein [Candidatus Limnocylindria bacterium]|nr:PKD domain-containing protein [Candidatus Limnocylindria bacterium]